VITHTEVNGLDIYAKGNYVFTISLNIALILKVIWILGRSTFKCCFVPPHFGWWYQWI